MVKKDSNQMILDTLSEKSCVKQRVYDNTYSAFKTFKKVLKYLVGNFNKQLHVSDKRITLEYRNRGQFEAEIKVAGDLLVFNMHSNIFEFDKGHGVWKTSYVKNTDMSAYCGIINIYNFLSDSFKYNRVDDLGYLIGRVFINKENHYFVEGKRQLGFLYNDFGSAVIDKKAIREIIQSAILYALEFDLLVPPYDQMQFISVEKMNDRINTSKGKTAKRLGFKFYTDNDVIA
ncbi:MAG: hypothetical protein KAT68_09940 [Bacteroidales bacterium]|nr:hypothetical protein [Bacteroidales bacterium]